MFSKEDSYQAIDASLPRDTMAGQEQDFDEFDRLFRDNDRQLAEACESSLHKPSLFGSIQRYESNSSIT